MSDTHPSRKWEDYMLLIYRNGKVPLPLGTVKFHEIEEKAREKLKDYPGTFMHAAGSAGTQSTCRANLSAFEKYGIIPRMMLTASNRALETTIFGIKHPSPIFLSSIAVQGIFHPDGELATAAAAMNMGVPFIMSNHASRSIEEVAKANGDGHRWYQMSWPRTEEVTLSLLERAKANGFTALLITLEVHSLGWRPHDLELGYHPYTHGIGCQVGKSDPVFMARYDQSPVHERPGFPYDPRDHDKYAQTENHEMKQIGLDWLAEVNSGGGHSWEDLASLKKLWQGPLIVKGIMHVLDAEKAMDCGADGIVVSNQGGRQFDGGIPALYALEMITRSKKIQEAQRSGKFTVFFDSGIRTGSDIIKAMALGAQGILLGRPWLYGLIIGGQAGVEQALQTILSDLYTTLGMAGYQNLEKIQGQRDAVVMKLDF